MFDRVAALKAGLDLQMPADGGAGAAAVAAALEAGEIDEATIRPHPQAVTRVAGPGGGVEWASHGGTKVAKLDSPAGPRSLRSIRWWESRRVCRPSLRTSGSCRRR